MQKKNRIPSLLVGAILLAGCGKEPIPKPRGYFRIDLPEQSYEPTSVCATRSELSTETRVVMREARSPEDCWFNIVYPKLKAQIHCTYTPVRGELSVLMRDANEFALNHEGKATAINKREYSHPENNAHGLLIDIKGQVASPIQFYMTDSTSHFLRGSLYFSSKPNPDSVAPVQDYIRKDIIRLMETVVWE